MARKLQLKHELRNVRQRDISVTICTSRIKETCDSLASINVTFKEVELMQVCVGGLVQKFGSFRTAIYMREKMPSFELHSMFLVEENHTVASTSTHVDNKM